MSYIKASSDLNIGAIELNRIVKSLDTDGFRKLFLKDAMSFGIFKNSLSGNFTNFLVQQGTNVGTIKHNEGFAVDSDGLIVYKEATDNIALTDDNLWYWIKVAHSYSPLELGTVTIDIHGNMTGTGTEFTKILRGLPNNPVKIAFNGSVLNPLAYEVAEVVSDTVAVLAGDFLAETGLKLKVYGSFTPDISVPSGNEYPFQYDACTFTLVQSVSAPAITANKEFFIARVKRNGSTVVIEDKRIANIFKHKGDYLASNINDADNPLLGIEAIKYNDLTSPRDTNLIFMSWTFRSNNWTIDTNTNKVTLNAGLGGKFKTTNDFTNGDFNGWRLYAKDGTYSIINSSFKSGSQINCILDSLNPDKFTDTTAFLVVTPDAEEIEMFFSPDVTSTGVENLKQKRIVCAINEPFIVVPLLAYNSPTCTYGFNYRYKTLNTFGTWRAMPSDNVSGYLKESSFDDAGNLVLADRRVYIGSLTAAFITLVQANNAYSTIIAGLSSGDLFGMEYVAINLGLDPVTKFQVGTRKSHVIITNDPAVNTVDSDYGTTYSLTQNAYFDLRTDLPVGLKNGNNFIIQFRGNYDLNGFQMVIVQDFVNSGSIGHPLHYVTQNELDAGASNNLLFWCVYNGSFWTVFKISSVTKDAAADGLTKGIAAFTAADFNSTGGVISIDYTNGQAAAAGTKGFLTSADWNIFNNKVATSRQVTAGTGLTGGGDLSTDRTLALATGAAVANLGFTPANELSVWNNPSSGNYTLVAGDKNKIVKLTGTTPIATTFASATLTSGEIIFIFNGASGNANVAAGSGITIVSDGSLTHIPPNGMVALINQPSTNTWSLVGDLTV